MNELAFATLLKEVVEKPGTLSKAYTAFHDYSLGNQMAALVQLAERGKEPSPIASYNAWREKHGRHVVKGAKAISLCMPITMKGKRETATGEEEFAFSRFVWRKNWFCLDDTDGAEFVSEVKSPEWDAAKALAALDISEVKFAMISGNPQGYAAGRTIAINPVAVLPHKTRFHELAHVVLGHTAEGVTMTDDEFTPKDVKEVEAESVAYILCNLLKLPGSEESRGYVQYWLGNAEISERSAQRIYATANKILKAGQEQEKAE